MLRFKKTISILIVCGLLISYFSYSSVPVAHALDGGGGYAAAAAGWAHFAKYVLKEFVLDLAARLTARLQLTGALNGIAQQVIQSGRTGRTPAFIQNWRNFITDAEYRGEDVFRSILANTENCPNIRRDMLSLFGVRAGTPITQNVRVGNLDSYNVRGKCTMPRGWTIQNYNRDFTGNGGWDALARLADPQNNFYGSTIIAMGELNVQRNLDRTADRAEAGANGFTGVRRSSRTGNSCDTPPTTGGQCVNDPFDTGAGRFCNNTGQACTSNNDCRQLDNSQARCTFLGNITTPSKILGEGAAEFIDSNLKWLTTSDEISEILGNFIQTMIGKLANYTADAIAPSNVAEPQKNNYEACVRTCNNTSSGSQMNVCIDRCYKNAGVDTPRSFEQSNFIGATNPVPPAVPPVPPTRSPIPLPAGATRVTVNLQTVNGQFLGAEGGGGSVVNANATSVGIWETFVLYDLNGGTLNSGDQVGITTSQFFALRAEGGGGTTLGATASDIGVWETFVIESTDGLATITNGSHASFKTWNLANFIRSEGGGGSTVDAAGASVGSWETYTITIR